MFDLIHFLDFVRWAECHERSEGGDRCAAPGIGDIVGENRYVYNGNSQTNEIQNIKEILIKFYKSGVKRKPG